MNYDVSPPRIEISVTAPVFNQVDCDLGIVEKSSFEQLGIIKADLLPFLLRAHDQTIIVDTGLAFEQRGIAEYEQQVISVLSYLQIQVSKYHGLAVFDLGISEEQMLFNFAQYPPFDYGGVLEFVLFAQLSPLERSFVLQAMQEGIAGIANELRDPDWGRDLLETLHWYETPDASAEMAKKHVSTGIPDQDILLAELKQQTEANKQALIAFGLPENTFAALNEYQVIMFADSNYRIGMQIDMSGGDLQISPRGYIVRVDLDKEGNFLMHNFQHEVRHLWQFLNLGNPTLATQTYTLSDSSLSSNFFHAFFENASQFIEQYKNGQRTTVNDRLFADVLNYVINGADFETTELSFLYACLGGEDSGLFSYKGIMRPYVDDFLGQNPPLPDYHVFFERTPNNQNPYIEADAQIWALMRLFRIDPPEEFRQFYLGWQI